MSAQVIQSSVSLLTKITDERVLRIAPRCYLHRLLSLLLAVWKVRVALVMLVRQLESWAGEVDDGSGYVERDVEELG
jgi:hypothetical protein